MITSVNELVRRMEKLGIETASIEREAIVDAAETAKVIFERVGGQYTIRGRGGRQVRLRAAVGSIERVGRGTRAIVKPYPKGFWLLVEKGSKAHIIAKGARNNRRRRSAEIPMATPYGPKMAVLNHKGHGPIGHPWETGKEEARRAVTRLFPNVVAREVHAEFKHTRRRRRR